MELYEVMGKKIYYGILFAGGLGFCQTGYSAVIKCDSPSVSASDGHGWTERARNDLVCWNEGGSSGSANSPNSNSEGFSGSTPVLTGYKPYKSTTVDPDGNGMMNCYKNLTESSQDNYHMDDGDRFRPDRVHPVLGKSRPHNGIDIQAKEGTPTYSMAFGYVSERGWSQYNGNYVRIKWFNGPFEYEATFIHLMDDSIVVKKEQTVFPGTLIAAVGSTGDLITGPHLHFQLKRTEKVFNSRGKVIGSEEELLDPLLFLGGDTCNKL
jgi:murein DD-endopeptidase MepM/ murein hydrolase activator NlpD